MLLRTIHLGYLVPILWTLSLLLLIFLFFLPWRRISRECSLVQRKHWLYLGAILFLALMIRGFLVPTTHLFYVDEHLYMDSAKRIKEIGQSVNCRFEGGDICLPIVQKAPGWPFMLSFMYRFSDQYSFAAFALVKGISILTMFLAFIFCALLFQNAKIGLWIATFMAVFPLHVQWSNTAEAAIPSLFIVLLTLVSCILFTRIGQWALGAVTATFLAFSMLVRYEHILLLPVVALAIAVTVLPIAKKHRELLLSITPTIIASSLLAALFFIFQGIGFFRPYSTSSMPLLYFIELPTFLSTISLMYVLIIPLIIGLFAHRNERMVQISVLFPLFLYSLLYLPFSSESRMLIIPSFFAIVFAAAGVDRIIIFFEKSSTKNLLATVLITLGVLIAAIASPYPLDSYLRENSGIHLLESSSLDTLSFYVPSECYIISEHPSFTSAVTESKGIRTNYAIAYPSSIASLISQGGCLYYFEDMYCKRKEGNFGKDCSIMHSFYNLSTERLFESDQHTITLYRIDGVRKAGEESA